MSPMMTAVHALGITQITSWGVSYYCLGILATAIAAETGWSLSFVFMGYTTALLTMGVSSTWIGQLIDARGARPVMCWGNVIVSLSLYALSLGTNETAYFVIWALMGIGMRCSLYDAAFAALVQVTPSRGRLAISYLTLYGAFASSVFWVVGHYLNQSVGWRQTLVVFALINLVVCLPLNWLGLARREEAAAPADANKTPSASTAAALVGKARTAGMALFAFAMSLNAYIFGVVSQQLVPMLEATGLAAATAVWVASLKGFAQFSGRVIEILFGSKLHAVTVGRIAVGILPVSMILLLASMGNFAAILTFTLLMGASQGVITIVRGSVPLALFGSEGYATVLGILATPVLIVNAASPTLFALIIDHWGWRAAQWSLLICSAASYLAMETMAYWLRRRQV